MSHTPHELAEEFPEHIEAMRRLKESDTHFARLFDEYHEVNRAVHRAEARVDTMSEFSEEELRKKRMVLKDEIWGHLTTSA